MRDAATGNDGQLGRSTPGGWSLYASSPRAAAVRGHQASTRTRCQIDLEESADDDNDEFNHGTASFEFF